MMGCFHLPHFTSPGHLHLSLPAPPGLTMWRVSAGSLVSGRGAPVRRLWRGLPPDLPRLHAVLERQSDHAIIFISGMLPKILFQYECDIISHRGTVAITGMIQNQKRGG